MKGKLNLLDQHGLKLSDIQQVISTLRPLEGGKEFLAELRSLARLLFCPTRLRNFEAFNLKQLD